MSSVYLNPQQSSSLTFLEQLKGDHHQQQQQQHSFPIIGYLHDHVTSSNNHHHAYFSCSSFENHRNSAEFLAMEYSRRTQEKVVEKLFQSHDKITNLSQNTTLLDGSGCSYIHPFDKGDDPKIEPIKTNIQKPKKCKPTKLRIMQKETVVVEKPKKMKVDHHKVQPHDDHVVQPQKNMKHHNTSYENNGSHGFLRMCSDCHTTTTPLWRSGPQGPKSLCNACGIRQRKARRAAMAAAAAAAAAAESTVTSPMSSTITTTTTTTIPSPKLAIDEEIKSKLNLDHEKNNTLPLKKRSKTLHFSSFDNNNNNNNNNNNEDSSINNIANINNNNNNNSYFEREFPIDEEEGAILLMALSCGLACSS